MKKETKNKKMGEHALCAKAIKKELKQVFPETKFSVKSDSFSMGNSVNVQWENGPTVPQVNEIVKKYEYSHYNTVEDIHEINNRRTDIPQAKYISTCRNIGIEIYEVIFEHLKQTNSNFENIKSVNESNDSLMKNLGVWTAKNYIYRIIHKFDLSNGLDNLQIKGKI